MYAPPADIEGIKPNPKGEHHDFQGKDYSFLPVVDSDFVIFSILRELEGISSKLPMENRQLQKLGLNPELSVEVQGKSVDNELFNFRTDALVLGSRSLLLRLKDQVELGSEIQVTILEKSASGTFRVFWTNTSMVEQYFPYGVEAVEFEGDVWFGYTPGPAVGAWLRCGQCSQIEETFLQDVDASFLTKGFLITRLCKKCASMTHWTIEEWPTVERRHAKRPRMEVKIKVTRLVSEFDLVDISETINVSREGACFRSEENYRVGEELMVAVPYMEEQDNIEVPAKVVRVDEVKDSPFRHVAIHLTQKEKS